ncbi:hypothetical protein H0H93_010304, partial [Arthromyces matolae]
MTGAESDTIAHEFEGVWKVDFQALLKLIYPLHLPFELPDLSDSEWISVLKLSSLWTMISLRELAIKSLQVRGLKSIQKVVLGRTYGITTWLKDGYIGLCNRTETLSVEDIHMLGLETALKLFNIREKRYPVQKNQNASSFTTSESFLDGEFGDEVQGIDSGRGFGTMEMTPLGMGKPLTNLESLQLTNVNLIQRRTAIPLEEASKLDPETLIQIFQAREKLRSSLNKEKLRLIPWRFFRGVFREEFGTVEIVGALYASNKAKMRTDNTPMSANEDWFSDNKIFSWLDVEGMNQPGERGSGNRGEGVVVPLPEAEPGEGAEVEGTTSALKEVSGAARVKHRTWRMTQPSARSMDIQRISLVGSALVIEVVPLTERERLVVVEAESTREGAEATAVDSEEVSRAKQVNLPTWRDIQRISPLEAVEVVTSTERERVLVPEAEPGVEAMVVEGMSQTRVTYSIKQCNPLLTP